MKSVSQDKINTNARLIALALNELKLRDFSFSTLEDLSTKLKSLNCPYAINIATYLKRQQLIVKRNDYYVFTDKHPFHAYNFLSVVERIRCQANKLQKINKSNVKKCSVKQVPSWKMWVIKNILRITL